MKKMILVLVAALLVMTLAYGRTASAEETLSGGWTAAEDYTVTEERQAIFEAGLKELLGVNYVPVAYLGSQVVAGTNHVFLAQSTVVYPGAQPTYVLVYLYQDLQGNVTLLNVADLDVGSLCTYGA